MTAVLSLQQIEDLLFNITVAVTGLAPSMVRQEYPENGAPAWLISDDIAFLFVVPVDSDYANFRDIQYVQQDAISAEQSIYYTRTMQVSCTLYGPHSFDLADTLRNGLLLETNRWTLEASGVYIPSQISQATRTRENRNGQWYDRSDLQIPIGVATLRTATVPYLQAATVEVIDDHGLERTIDITVP